MSQLIRCNRCGTEEDVPQEKPSILGIRSVPRLSARWNRVIITKVPTREGTEGKTDILDLCEDCREILEEQFLKGAAVAPITQPLVQTILPHQPMTDCMLVWDPERGNFLCEHDHPARYHKLCRDQAQNAAEGVPAQDVQDAVDRLAEDMSAAANFSVVQRCGKKCSEAHTYKKGCLLASPALKARPDVPEQRDGGHDHE